MTIVEHIWGAIHVGLCKVNVKSFVIGARCEISEDLIFKTLFLVHFSSDGNKHSNTLICQFCWLHILQGCRI